MGTAWARGHPGGTLPQAKGYLGHGDMGDTTLGMGRWGTPPWGHHPGDGDMGTLPTWGHPGDRDRGTGPPWRWGHGGHHALRTMPAWGRCGCGDMGTVPPRREGHRGHHVLGDTVGGQEGTQGHLGGTRTLCHGGRGGDLRHGGE